MLVLQMNFLGHCLKMFCLTRLLKIQNVIANLLATYIPVGVSKEYVARELNQTDYAESLRYQKEQKYSPQTALCTVAVTG